MLRRARDRDGTPIPPMTIGNMRAHGIRSLDAICEETLCGHSAQVDVRALPDDVAVPDVARRLRCSRCGSKEVSTRPNWLEYGASGRAARLLPGSLDSRPPVPTPAGENTPGASLTSAP